MNEKISFTLIFQNLQPLVWFFLKIVGTGQIVKSKTRSWNKLLVHSMANSEYATYR